MDLRAALAECPLVAILRGIRPDECESIGMALFEEGFRIIEVPLNSPEPLKSIAKLSALLGGRALIGAGTVMSPSDVNAIAEAGGRLIVMPHSDAAVITAAKSAGLWCLPGVATPTEAFAALKQGADGLKLFPAEAIPPAVVKAWRAVVPSSVPLLPVGGVGPSNLRDYLVAGANGFGLGSFLFKPGKAVDAVRADAQRIVAAYASGEADLAASPRRVDV